VARYIKGWADPTAGLGVWKKEKKGVMFLGMRCCVPGLVVPYVSKELVASFSVNH
jgi:hypothetical protein